MKFKKIVSDVHLWLGLITAPLVFFICITGTIIVFSDEIMELSAGSARFVKEVQKERLETEELISILKESYPNRWQPSYMVCYRDPKRSVRFNTYSETEGLHMVYMDQYTGEILKDDATIYFFYIIAHLHNSLLLHEPGAWIVDIGTVIFFIALITGLILWWPKRWDKKHKKAVFTIKWKANRKRINLDLHKVGGFYALGISLLLTITGLIIAFKPLAAVTKNAFGGNAEITMKQVFAKQATDSLKTNVPINLAVEKAFEAFPEKTELQLYTYWLNDWDYYVVYVANKIGIKSAMNAEFVAYDKETGRQSELTHEFNINKKVENVYWTLHMGNYMGIIGKIITFIAGLIATTLPVTGFYIWKSKRKKK
jgi:uncharacterized iron-regulated membrane protein